MGILVGFTWRCAVGDVHLCEGDEKLRKAEKAEKNQIVEPEDKKWQEIKLKKK